jgi:hypothetical protein
VTAAKSRKERVEYRWDRKDRMMAFERYSRFLETTLGWFGGLFIMALLFLVLPRLSRQQSTVGFVHPAHSSDHGPVVAFNPPSFDYGTLFQQQTINHTFRLINRTTNEMHVVAIQTSCSCTLVSTSMLGTIVRPNDEVLFPVSFDTGSRSGPTDSRIDVALQAEGIRYVAQARLYGAVVPDFDFDPKALAFGALNPAEKSTRTVAFRPEALAQFELVATQTWLGPFEVWVQKQMVRVTFHAPESTHSETFCYSLRVATSSQRAPEVIIPLSGQVVPDVEVTPRLVVLSGNGAFQESRFTLRTTKPSRINRVLINPNKVIPSPIQSEDWALSHVFAVSNALLSGADRMDFELEVRNRAGQTEARSSSVQVKSLNN